MAASGRVCAPTAELADPCIDGSRLRRRVARSGRALAVRELKARRRAAAVPPDATRTRQLAATVASGPGAGTRLALAIPASRASHSGSAGYGRTRVRAARRQSPAAPQAAPAGVGLALSEFAQPC